MKVPVWAICLEDFSCSCSESLFWMMSPVGELRYIGFMRGSANLGCVLQLRTSKCCSKPTNTLSFSGITKSSPSSTPSLQNMLYTLNLPNGCYCSALMVSHVCQTFKTALELFTTCLPNFCYPNSWIDAYGVTEQKVPPPLRWRQAHFFQHATNVDSWFVCLSDTRISLLLKRKAPFKTLS